MSATQPAPRRAAVEALLTGLHSSPVEVETWERLEPWAVARVTLRGPIAPRTVIVKWVRTHPIETHAESWRLCAELAALRFLSDDLNLALTPRVIAADLSAGLVAMEDLAPRTALDHLLRRDGAAAHADRLVAFARARGELSAATVGHADTYHARRAALGPIDPAANLVGRFARLRGEALRQAAALGVPVTGPAENELGTVLAELSDPGPFLALSNGDAETNNLLLNESGPADARLIDFEFADYTHALVDAVCLHVPGPAWMSVGDPIATGLADHYRRALACGAPEAEDDRRYGFGLAAACISWAIVRLQRFALLDARSPGDGSRPQLVETLEAAARTAETCRALPHLTGWSRRTADLLRRRWPDADLDFTGQATFPPYTARG
ncbi:hypothetical protein [Kitasatospora sp. NPDC005856]|uniref:hypothetical protein n=1 Tax=Kitasatospora sp. NPDC005856 TaxID=3154566 RepID=UPI00340E4ACC